MFNQLDFVYQISDDPVTGYRRKVRVYSFFFRSREKILILYCEVVSFTDAAYEQPIQEGRFKPYEIELHATNDTYIDPTTGDIVFEPTEGYEPEYNYWVAQAKAGVNLETAFNQTVTIADNNGRFN